MTINLKSIKDRYGNGRIHIRSLDSNVEVYLACIPQLIAELEQCQSRIGRALVELGIEYLGETEGQFKNRIAACLHGQMPNGDELPEVGKFYDK